MMIRVGIVRLRFMFVNFVSNITQSLPRILLTDHQSRSSRLEQRLREMIVTRSSSGCRNRIVGWTCHRLSLLNIWTFPIQKRSSNVGRFSLSDLIVGIHSPIIRLTKGQFGCTIRRRHSSLMIVHRFHDQRIETMTGFRTITTGRFRCQGRFEFRMNVLRWIEQNDV